MNNEESKVVKDALKTINKHFGFLFEQGYEIISVKDFPDAGWPVWEVIL